jgi:hypothetical protein
MLEVGSKRRLLLTDVVAGVADKQSRAVRRCSENHPYISQGYGEPPHISTPIETLVTLRIAL